MTVNVKKMKPVEMVRFLNSTELGTVITAAMVCSTAFAQSAGSCSA